MKTFRTMMLIPLFGLLAVVVALMGAGSAEAGGYGGHYHAVNYHKPVVYHAQHAPVVHYDYYAPVHYVPPVYHYTPTYYYTPTWYAPSCHRPW